MSIPGNPGMNKNWKQWKHEIHPVSLYLFYQKAPLRRRIPLSKVVYSAAMFFYCNVRLKFLHSFTFMFTYNQKYAEEIVPYGYCTARLYNTLTARCTILITVLRKNIRYKKKKIDQFCVYTKSLQNIYIKKYLFPSFCRWYAKLSDKNVSISFLIHPKLLKFFFVKKSLCLLDFASANVLLIFYIPVYQKICIHRIRNEF